MESKSKRKTKNKYSRKLNNNNNNNNNKLRCAPKADNSTNDFTCYSSQNLNTMKSEWNLKHPESEILSTDDYDIWKELNGRLSNKCDIESCWMKQQFIANHVDNIFNENNIFAPKSPPSWIKNHTTWLNSENIEAVMNQYEMTYPTFKFIGPTPIDFDTRNAKNSCVWDELCMFDLKTMISKGIGKIGIIFNTDTHNNSGMHWISMFIDIPDKFIFFFDSNGPGAPPEVDKLRNRIMSQARQLGIKLKYYSNENFRHQKGNTECGMYCLFFIISLITEKYNYKHFKSSRISDEFMENLRDVYFNIKL